jgi:hypothetical protein
MKFLKTLYKNNKGQSLILFVLFFTIFLGIIAISIDTSWIILNKWKIQNAADFSAMSGAQFLPLNTTDAYTTADDVFQQNYENTVTNSDISFSNSNYSINVDYKDSVDLFFLSLFGVDKVSIEGKSGAEVAPVYKPDGIIPIALNSKDLDIVYGEERTLIGNDVDPVKGNFGLIDPTDDGSMGELNPNDVEEYIANDYMGEEGMPFVGKNILTRPGKLQQHVKDGIEARLECGKNNAVVPIVDFSSATGAGAHTEVKVLGFASIEIISYTEEGNKGNSNKGNSNNGYNLVVKFTEFISSNSIGKDGIPYYGAKVVRMVS